MGVEHGVRKMPLLGGPHLQTVVIWCTLSPPTLNQWRKPDSLPRTHRTLSRPGIDESWRQGSPRRCRALPPQKVVAEAGEDPFLPAKSEASEDSGGGGGWALIHLLGKCDGFLFLRNGAWGLAKQAGWGRCCHCPYPQKSPL